MVTVEDEADVGSAMRRHAKVSAVRIGRQLVFPCPHCGELHWHGAVGPRFGAGNGPRSPHCTRGPATRIGYSHTLTEVSPRTFVERQLRRLGFRGSEISELLAAVLTASPR